MGFSGSLLLAAVASTYLTQTTVASRDDECSGTLDEIREHKLEFNSTKTTEFTPSSFRPWIFTLGLSDRRKKGTPWGPYETSQYIETFLSIPDEIVNSTRADETSVCIYLLDGRNATANDGNENGHSCNGVLSDKCQKVLRSIDGPTDGECPDQPMNIKEACGEYVFQWRKYCESRLAIAKPHFYNTNCTTPSVPGVSLPGGYNTFPFMARGLIPSDDYYNSYGLYDLRVRQPIPILFTV